MKLDNKILIVAIALTLPSAASAFDFNSFDVTKTSVSPELSTLGMGIKGKYEVRENLKFVASLNKFDYKRSDIGGIDGATVDANLDMLSYGIGVEYNPFATGFTLGAGVLKNDNSFGLKGRSNRDVTIGGQTFTAEEVADINGNVEFDKFAPYLTVGYQGNISSNWTFGATLGALFQGSAKINMSASGLAQNETRLTEALERERAELQHDLKDFKIMPILGLNVTYKF